MRLLFLGDIMCHDKQLRLAYDREDDSYDFYSSFAQMKDYFSGFDHVICNLETVITPGPWNGYPKFSTPEEFLKAMRESGIDVCCLANNHCNDMGSKGIEYTISCLEKNGFTYTGESVDPTDKYVILDDEVAIVNVTSKLNVKNESNDVFINFSEDFEMVKAIIDEIKCNGFTGKIVCVVHWGNEYEKESSEEQRLLAEKTIESGADLVVGSHPHVIQDFAKTGGTNVVYSLGNALSSQPEHICRHGIALEATIGNNDICIKPRKIGNYLKMSLE